MTSIRSVASLLAGVACGAYFLVLSGCALNTALPPDQPKTAQVPPAEPVKLPPPPPPPPPKPEPRPPITHAKPPAPAAAAEPPVVRETVEGRIVKLWFGTNRKPELENKMLFGAKRDVKLNFGTCEVLVPTSHETGSLGRSDWDLLKRMMGRDDPLQMHGLPQRLDGAAFWQSLKAAMEYYKGKDGHALIFIHGYNNSFEDAALRTAQIWADLKINGAPAFFSWPSRDGTLRYTDDEATIDASEIYLEEFLTKVTANLKAEKVHVIAHSMGNRAFLRVVSNAVARAEHKSGFRFAKIFLAAPDVDKDLFLQLARAYPQVSEKTTLYISEGDKAVLTSELLHDYERVGSPPPVITVKDIDTVDVKVKKGLLSLGHSFFAEYGTVMEDIRSLMVRGTPSDKRKSKGGYWELAAE